MAADAMKPRPPSSLPTLDRDDINSSSRRRKRQEMEDKLTTLESVVAQLSNDNLELRREISSFNERVQLLEKVFMFVDFDELQKVVDRLSKETTGSDISRCGGYANTTALVEQFKLGRSSDDGKSDNLIASKLSCKSSEESILSSVESMKEILASRRNDSFAASSIKQDVEADLKCLEEYAKASAPPSKVRALQKEDSEPDLRRPNTGSKPTLTRSSRSQALRNAVATVNRAELVSAARTMDDDTASSIDVTAPTVQYPQRQNDVQRSKCYDFAKNYRQRYGQDSAFPSFIYERLGQDGMTEEEIDQIGRELNSSD